MGAVAEQDGHQFRGPLLACPRVLLPRVADACLNSFLDAMLGKDAKPFHADTVGKHFSAWSGFGDRLINFRQQRIDVACGKVLVNRAQAASGSAVFVFQASPNCAVQRFAVYPIE